MTIAPQIDKQSSAGHLRLEWDNRQMPKDRFAFCFMIFFWMLWAPLTCWATTMIFTSDGPVFFCIWCLFGWTGTILIPLTLVRRRWREWIELDAEAITWGAQGLWAPKSKSLPLQAVEEVGFGRVSDDHEREFTESLTIYEKPGQRRFRCRHMLAYWLRKPYKQQIFEALRRHAESTGIPIAFKTYGV